MKKIAVLCAMVALLVLAGCSSVDFTQSDSGSINSSAIVAKDFDVVGVVSVEHTEVIEEKFFGLIKNHTGSKPVYNDLMEQAQAKGGDDIINVRVDKTEIWDGGSVKTYKYVTTAIAIKYKDAQPQVPAASGSSSLGGGGGLAGGLKGFLPF